MVVKAVATKTKPKAPKRRGGDSQEAELPSQYSHQPYSPKRSYPVAYRGHDLVGRYSLRVSSVLRVMVLYSLEMETKEGIMMFEPSISNLAGHDADGEMLGSFRTAFYGESCAQSHGKYVGDGKRFVGCMMSWKE